MKSFKIFIIIIITAFLCNGCSQYVIYYYKNCSTDLYESEIKVGYLANNIRNNGLPKNMLFAFFNNKDFEKKILSIESSKYGRLEIKEDGFERFPSQNLIYYKTLKGRSSKIYKEILLDTIKIVLMENNQTKTILFHN